MNRRLTYCIFIIGVILFLLPNWCYGKKKNTAFEKKLSNHEKRNKKRNKNKRIQRTIEFKYNAIPLVDIVNEYAALKHINILFPQGDLAKELNSKVTYHLDKQLSIDEAWDLVKKLLDLVGYTIRPQGTDMYAIVKGDIQHNIASQPLELYIDVPIHNLPHGEQKIRVFHYFSNISLKVSKDAITQIFKDMLSINAIVLYEEQSNAVLIIDRANNIKALLKIIDELDKGGIRDAAEVLELHYTSAKLVDDLFNNKIFPQKKGPGVTQPQEYVPYFPKNAKVVDLGTRNAVVIMGSERDIAVIKDFIIKYIDHPLETGDSILHVYELQYLKAEDIAEVLQNLLKPMGKPEQAATGKALGPPQEFEDVIIVAEISKKAEQIKPTNPKGYEAQSGGPQITGAEAGGVQIGGNKLIIAARSQDWKRIKQLLKEIDIPQLQIAVEVLLVDVDLMRDKVLGSQMRNKFGFKDSFLQAANWQTAMLNNPVLKPTLLGGQLPPDALMANLLELNPADINLANATTPGSFIVSFDEPNSGVWSVWQILNQFRYTTVLSQPFVVTRNHQQASIMVGEIQRVRDESVPRTSNIEVKVIDLEANVAIDILPRISKDHNINLQVIINVNQFVNTEGNRRMRLVETNANVGNGEVLVIGGLTREDQTITMRKLPVLGDLPLVGWFFKNERKLTTKVNLIALISPTIIEPYTKGRLDQHTWEKINYAKRDVDSGLFLENLRDPITRWFFKPEEAISEKWIDAYVYDDYEKPTGEEGEAHRQIMAERLKEKLRYEENPLLKSEHHERQKIFDS